MAITCCFLLLPAPALARLGEAAETGLWLWGPVPQCPFVKTPAITHQHQLLALLQPGRGTCGARCALELKWEDGQQNAMFLSLPKIFYLPSDAAFVGWETFSREELWNRKFGLILLWYQSVAKNTVAVLACEKSSDERPLPNRPNSEEE